MVFLGAVFLSDEVMTAVQMLWVNLIMDTLAALALATEPPSEALLERLPYKRNDRIINAVMWRNIFGHAIYQVIVLLILIFKGAQLFNLTNYNPNEPFYVTKEWANDNYDNDDAVLASLANTAILNNEFNTPTAKCTLFTIVFQSFVMMTIFNIINARKLGDKEYNIFSNFFNNGYFFIILFLITFGQFWIVQNGGMLMRVTSLDKQQFLICTVLGALTLPWGILIKFALPSNYFERFQINEEEMKEEEASSSIVGSIRKSSSFKESFKGGSSKGLIN